MKRGRQVQGWRRTVVVVCTILALSVIAAFAVLALFGNVSSRDIAQNLGQDLAHDVLPDAWADALTGWRGTATAPATTPTTSALTTSALTTFTTSTTLPMRVVPADADGKFSLAIFPDTQMEVTSPTMTSFENRSQSVVRDKTKRDTRYVLHVGDMVFWDNDAPQDPNKHSQYKKASDAMNILESGGVSWASALGNHDTHAVGPDGGGARPFALPGIEVRNTTTHNAYFPPSRFPDIAGTWMQGKVDNAYRLFDAGGKRWLILSLEIWPRDDVVTWAKQVVSAFEDRNVIILTHAYLQSNGEVQMDNGGYGANSPARVRDELVRVYPNVKFVFSGHVDGAAVRVDVGAQGNKVVEMLTSFHDTHENHVRYVEIDTKKNRVTTDVMSPQTGRTFSQYTESVEQISFR